MLIGSLFLLLTTFATPVPTPNSIFPDAVVQFNSGDSINVKTGQNAIEAYIVLSQQLFNAQNRARTNPKAFAIELLNFGDQSAANLCEAAPTLGGLTYVGALREAAKDLVTSQGPTGQLGHTGPDGSSPYDRMNRHGTWHIIAGENIMYGPASAMGIMAGLINSPEHFANIFRPQFKVAGMSCGPHSTYGTMCVIDYAGIFDANGH